MGRISLISCLLVVIWIWSG